MSASPTVERAVWLPPPVTARSIRRSVRVVGAAVSPGEQGLLIEHRTVDIGLQVLDALCAAHRDGIAHRVTRDIAVTGRSPFQREDTQATLAAILHTRPVPPSHAGQLWPVINGLLVKDPASRLGTEPARQLLAKVARSADTAGSPVPAQTRAGPGDSRPKGVPLPVKPSGSVATGRGTTRARPPAGRPDRR